MVVMSAEWLKYWARYLPPLIGILSFSISAGAQSAASIEGEVTDQNGAVIAGAYLTASSSAIGIERVTLTDDTGTYQMVDLPVGNYRLEVSARGFKAQVVERVRVEVGRRITQNFQLQVGDVSQRVNVNTAGDLIEHATISVGHVVAERMVRELPLNGRYFLDLGLLAPGSVTPPQGAFSSAPMRGLGALAFNTAGNREETINYLVNGITLNNLTFSSIEFQPSISTVQEFKMDNSTMSAEYGQTSGAAVNVATRSGGSRFHGEVFEFLRNNALDARNFFNLVSSEPPPFKRNQFGGTLGGPIIRGKTFFFFSYEGLRQLQNLSLNSVVLSDADRVSITDTAAAKLAVLIPRPNFVDSSGTPRFIGSSPGPVDNGQWGLDISHILTSSDRLHGYYSFNLAKTVEPNISG